MLLNEADAREKYHWESCSLVKEGKRLMIEVNEGMEEQRGRKNE